MATLTRSRSDRPAPPRIDAGRPDAFHAALPRSAVEAVVARLPETTSWAQAIDYLVVSARIAQGEADLGAGLESTTDEVLAERKLMS